MASKMVKQGGLYLNNQRVTDGALKVTLDHMLEQSLCVLRTGKKSQFLVRVV